MINAVSNTLFHFIDRSHKNEPIRQFDTFKSIIENGLKFSDISVEHWEVKFSNKGICFTDLPLYLSEQHSIVYGKFGIGFTKEFVKNRGGNPVFYFVDWDGLHEPNQLYGLRGILMENLKNTAKLCLDISNLNFEPSKILLQDGTGKAREITPSVNLMSLANQMWQMFSMFKEIGDLGPASDYTNRNDTYYLEREWRIILYKLHETSEYGFIDERNDEIFLKIQQRDIRIITVPNEDIRRMVYDYFWQQKESHPNDFDKQYIPTIIVYDELSQI